MTTSQKRAIWYAMRRKELENQEIYLKWKGLYDEFEQSKYKSMTWFIKSKGLVREYNTALFFNNMDLRNLPRR